MQEHTHQGVVREIKVLQEHTLQEVEWSPSASNFGWSRWTPITEHTNKIKHWQSEVGVVCM